MDRSGKKKQKNSGLQEEAQGLQKMAPACRLIYQLHSFSVIEREKKISPDSLLLSRWPKSFIEGSYI